MADGADNPHADAASLRDHLRRQVFRNDPMFVERVRALSKPPRDMRQLREEAAAVRVSGYDEIRHRMHRGLVDLLNPQAVAQADVAQVETAVEQYIGRELDGETVLLSRPERNRLKEDLVYELLGLGPLAPLLSDPTVADILINGPHHIYVERHGVLEPTGVRFHDGEHLMLTVERILSRVGRRVDESSPLADARLPDGSRVNVIIPPLALNGPVVSIRRFSRDIVDIRELVKGGSLSDEAADFLRLAVEAKLNVVVSGATGAGKTTMLNCLSQAIPDTERILTVEDTAELILHHEHVVRLEARPPNTEGRGAVTIRDLVRNALRMRPDRIIVGEVRGAEALDMLQAMNTGHDGSLTTLHANSPRDALSRLETMMLMADVALPQRVLREQIASALQLVVHLSRFTGGQRGVSAITEITGIDTGTILMQDLFRTQRDERGRQVLRGCGLVSGHQDRFEAQGIALDPQLFRET
jgi:pilus assembly protein CpaF